ncbi:hypothetical protein CRUP_030144 [Coryphaenoides rupestris]|nr:hypothetical protein CRUP_030144 [Coryphaenoides rupestris]
MATSSAQLPVREPYGINLDEPPADEDLLIYEREPVSRFQKDSVYATSPPQVDRDSRDIFEGHVMTGLGQVRPLCKEDVLMYREYIKNRYM